MRNQQKYAELIVKSGVNVQPGQKVMINISVKLSDFAELLAKTAYDAGASEVHVRWRSAALQRLTVDRAAEEVLQEVPQWFTDYLNYYADNDACAITITNYVPHAMEGVDLERLTMQTKSIGKAIKHYQTRFMSNKNAWTVAAYPTIEWAEKVYPQYRGAEALDHLWEAILKASRAAGDDPITDWQSHQDVLKRRVDYLNKANFQTLHYTNGNGTDLKIGLPQGHIWTGGLEEVSAKAHQFSANIPTEEVFTCPHRERVDGRVYSTKPLIYRDNVIDEFWLEFKAGQVVDFDAKEGREILEKLLSVDQGAKHLGEVALVPYDSPISNMDVLFYSTLYDENASCHLAVGRAYPINITGGADMDIDALKEHGLNDSMVHEDFMIGSADMQIVGRKADGSEVVIFENGNFAF